ncbi:17473_t:CDS:2, partial [Gigaspora rosea]
SIIWVKIVGLWEAGAIITLALWHNIMNPFDCNGSDSDNDDNLTSRTAELRSFGILNTDNVPVTENELTLFAIQQLLNKSNKSNNSQLFDNTIISDNNKHKSNASNPPLEYAPHAVNL